MYDVTPGSATLPAAATDSRAQIPVWRVGRWLGNMALDLVLPREIPSNKRRFALPI